MSGCKRFDVVSWQVLMVHLYYCSLAQDRVAFPLWDDVCAVFGLPRDILFTANVILQRCGLIRFDSLGKRFRVLVLAPLLSPVDGGGKE